MILNRVGNKARLADLIIPLFPEHKAYIEPFFGAGAIFFHKPKAQYNFLNDLDSEVYNFWKVVQEKPEELLEQLELMPVSEELFNHWKKEIPTDSVMKALRFLFLSNFSFLGVMDVLRIGFTETKKVAIKELNNFLKGFIFDAYIGNRDFGTFLKSICIRAHRESEINGTFAYCDPPYVDKSQAMYDCPEWSLEDLRRLIETLNSMGIKYAISEYSTDSVLQLTAEYKLNIHYLKEVQSIKNRSTEILLTNYQTNQLKLF